jgi:glycine/D-amino acid oxidase-like deaminating enzyme
VVAQITARVADLQAQGENVEWLDRDRMAALIGTDYYRGGMLDRRSGMVQPFSYARGLAAAAAASGARIFRDARVVGLARENGKWLLTTPNAQVTATQVLIATNGYTGDLHPALKTAMVVVQSYQVATDPLPSELDRKVLASRLPVSDLMRLGIYFRRDDAGRFVIGARGSLTDRERLDLFAAAEDKAYTLYPSLREVGFAIRWGGKLALTIDHLPRLVTLEPGLHAAYGCNGRGVALATMMGKIAAERMRGISHPDLPIANLPPARYPFHALRLPAMAAISGIRQLRERFVRG